MSDELNQEIRVLRLKNQALKERVSAIVSDYEDKDADRRVEVTLLVEALNEAREEIQRLHAENAEKEATAEIPVTDGGTEELS